jgi:hypothetical protein
MPDNIYKIVDLGGGGDFSSLAAFIAWLYNNYNPLDRNACAICTVSSGNTYGDSAAWGSLPSFSNNATILIVTTKEHWFNGIFSSTRYYLATAPTQPDYWYRLVFCRVQIGAPGSPITATIKAGLFLCGVVSSASTAVQSDVVANSMIVCTTNSQTAISCPVSVLGLITRNLLVTRPGYTGSVGIYGPGANGLGFDGNHIVRFTTPVDNGGYGYTYYNSTTASSISPYSETNILNATPTFVDENNWNYILSINDTSAKNRYNPSPAAIPVGGLCVPLNHNGITGYRFMNSSIGPTEPDPQTYPPWLIKVVNTDGGGDFTSLNAAIVWLYTNYPDLVASNIRAKIICMGSTADNTDVSTTGSTTDQFHYIYIVAHDNYRFKGIPNLAMLYKRSVLLISETKHLFIEGIQINQGSYSPGGLPYLVVDCYISSAANICYGYLINSILQLSTTNTSSNFYASLMNCTIVNTTPSSGVIPRLYFSVNCIAVGARLFTGTNFWYYNLGVITNLTQGISLYCKYSQTIQFVNSSQNDYRLSMSDTAAKLQGVYAGSYLEGALDVELKVRAAKSSYGAHEPYMEKLETLYGAEVLTSAPNLVSDTLYGIDSLIITKQLLETLYCGAEDLYRGALSGRILIEVQRKTSRIYRI